GAWATTWRSNVTPSSRLVSNTRHGHGVLPGAAEAMYEVASTPPAATGPPLKPPVLPAGCVAESKGRKRDQVRPRSGEAATYWRPHSNAGFVRTVERQASVRSSHAAGPAPPLLSSWLTNDTYSVPVVLSAYSHARSQPITCGPGPSPGGSTSPGPASSG